MSRELTLVAQPLTPSNDELQIFQFMAEKAVQSQFYRELGAAPGVLMKMLAARELGIPPLQALNGGLNIIQGKVELSSVMMNAIIRRAGHSIQSKEHTETKCVLIGKRKDNGDTMEVTYTIDEAKGAGLIKSGGAWQKDPKAMLFARCISRLARELFADVIRTAYVEGEISSIEHKQMESTPERNIEATIEVVDDENSLIESYLSYFISGERDDAMRYLEAVKNHFQWDTTLAIKNILSDVDKLPTKFKTWVAKNK